MECPPKPSVVVPVLILLVYVTAAAEPASALKLEPAGTSSHIPPLVDCARPAPAARSNSNNLSAFRANLLALLDALPPAVAAAHAPPGGFTSDLAQSGGAVGGDRAFARASCYGSGSSASDDCLNCLSAAARGVTDDGCHGRRGGIWRAGCFLSYADTGASTAREDAWRGWFYDDGSDDDDGTPTAACVANTTEAECSRCLDESARVVPALKERRQVSLLHRNSVVVVGYACYLRVPILPPTPQWLVTVEFAVVGVALGIAVIIEIGCLRVCIEIAGNQFNPAAV